jgi:hypothetical protein
MKTGDIVIMLDGALMWSNTNDIVGTGHSSDVGFIVAYREHYMPELLVMTTYAQGWVYSNQLRLA